MLGRFLISWMYEQERTPVYLCREAGVDPDKLIDLIVGAAAPGEDTLNRLAEATGLPLDQLRQAAADQAAGTREDDPLRCFRVRDVAQILQVSEDTVRAEMDSGSLGSVTFGQRVKRVPREALEQRLSQWREPGRDRDQGE